MSSGGQCRLGPSLSTFPPAAPPPQQRGRSTGCCQTMNHTKQFSCAHSLPAWRRLSASALCKQVTCIVGQASQAVHDGRFIQHCAARCCSIRSQQHRCQYKQQHRQHRRFLGPSQHPHARSMASGGGSVQFNMPSPARAHALRRAVAAAAGVRAAGLGLGLEFAGCSQTRREGAGAT